LRKIWGPRVPRLLEVIKWRCLWTICPLTPQLLSKWVDSPAAFSQRQTARDYFSTFRLPREAHVRLIAALDKTIPCWLETNHKPLGTFILIYQRFSFLAPRTAPSNAMQSQGAKLDPYFFAMPRLFSP